MTISFMQCQQCGKPFSFNRSKYVRKHFVKKGMRVEFFCCRDHKMDFIAGIPKPDWGKWFEDGVGRVKPGAIYD